jgi:hypothetical protein
MKKFCLFFSILIPLLISCHKTDQEQVLPYSETVQLRTSVNAEVQKYSTKRDCLRKKGDCMVAIHDDTDESNSQNLETFFPVNLTILENNKIKIKYLISNEGSEDGINLSVQSDINFPASLCLKLNKSSIKIKAGIYKLDFVENVYGSAIVDYE